MNSRRVALLVCVCLFLLAGVWLGHARAADDTNSFAAADAQILNEIHDHSEAMQNLEYLSDSIGPRLTGSSQLKQANEWTADMFRKYGLTNVHLEPWTIAHSWTRGSASARIIAPTEHPLTIASAGWSPSTKGKVRGPVVYVEVRKKEDLEKYRGKLKGAIVMIGEPGSLSPPRPEEQDGAVLRAMQPPPPMKGEPAPPSPFAAFAEIARLRNELFKSEGVAAVLRDSNKPHALLNMTGIGGEKFEIGAIPTAFITGEGYRLLYRMQKRGPVQVEIEMKNSFSSKPVEVYNTVAELRGSEKPDEIVIIGGHLDSWDLGTGTTDNGTGTMAVLEAARTLAKLNLKPKRTIRFVLFTGEEEGLVGSQKYVEAHKAELDKISAVLVHDTGTGRVLALGLHDNYESRQIVDEVIAPLKSLDLLEPSMDRSFGTDHASFDEAGVPGFYCIQALAEYNRTHHSQSDTFDKAWKDDLNQGAQVLAAWAYNTAELPQMMPRRPLPPRAAQPANGEAAAAPSPKPDPVAEMDTKIIEQVKADEAELKANLTYLADRIGPRLTGSKQLDEASHWTMEQFKKAGLTNPHLESWTIANSWTRGPATGQITSPAVHRLTLETAGWSAPTNGTVHGSIVGITAKTVDELQQYKGKLQGAIAVTGPPTEEVPPDNPLLTPWGEGSLPLAHAKNNQPVNTEELMKLRRAQTQFFTDEKVAAVLNASEKWFGEQTMSASGRQYEEGKVPTAYITRENYAMIWRLLDAGPVEADVNIQSSLSGKPVEVYNTVAEIPGSEKPDEVVIIGGHLDSWDLGEGATDNGTGSMAVIAAARALQKLGVKPKRTIRFVLFTGEEQGLNGSRAYVKAHHDELPKISGVLVHDTGTGKVLTIGLMGNYNVRETVDHVVNALARDKNIALHEPTLRSEGGSDHVPFDQEGVPGFWCVQDVANYDRMHHSQADTLDHVQWDDLTEGAQVLAVFAYNVAELPGMLPRKPAKVAPAR
ncbi:MAG TPA: M20/M25/M40 family metallo-hydrolase [Candidatus Acidoferrales bacterium]|nr:M20/M25/M40 family metallo-hydrolase [Candidatus Acidoferrales bacterium]